MIAFPAHLSTSLCASCSCFLLGGGDGLQSLNINIWEWVSHHDRRDQSRAWRGMAANAPPNKPLTCRATEGSLILLARLGQLPEPEMDTVSCWMAEVVTHLRANQAHPHAGLACCLIPWLRSWGRATSSSRRRSISYGERWGAVPGYRLPAMLLMYHPAALVDEGQLLGHHSSLKAACPKRVWIPHTCCSVVMPSQAAPRTWTALGVLV